MFHLLVVAHLLSTISSLPFLDGASESPPPSPIGGQWHVSWIPPTLPLLLPIGLKLLLIVKTLLISFSDLQVGIPLLHTSFLTSFFFVVVAQAPSPRFSPLLSSVLFLDVRLGFLTLSSPLSPLRLPRPSSRIILFFYHAFNDNFSYGSFGFLACPSLASLVVSQIAVWHRLPA